jgi:hypothetical protein
MFDASVNCTRLWTISQKWKSTDPTRIDVPSDQREPQNFPSQSGEKRRRVVSMTAARIPVGSVVGFDADS